LPRVATGKPCGRVAVARSCPQTHADAAASAGRNPFFHATRVDHMIARVYITKDRRNLLPLERVGSCDKSERRNNDFTAETGGTNGNFQGDCRIAHCDAVFDAQKISKVSFKLLDVRTIIGKPPSIQQIVDSCQEPFTVTNVGSPYMQFLSEGREIS